MEKGDVFNVAPVLGEEQTTEPETMSLPQAVYGVLTQGGGLSSD